MEILDWFEDVEYTRSVVQVQCQQDDTSEDVDVCSSPEASLESLLPAPNEHCKRIHSFDENHNAIACSLCFLNGVVPQTSNPEEANAKYQWSARSDPHQKFLEDLRKATPASSNVVLDDASMQKYLLSMSWDLVAIKDVGPNEAVMVYVEGLTITKR